jgi:hypothetical protein
MQDHTVLETARALGINAARVYLAKHRISASIREEVEKLRTSPMRTDLSAAADTRRDTRQFARGLGGYPGSLVIRRHERQIQPSQTYIAIHVAFYSPRHFRRSIAIVKDRQPAAGFNDRRKANKMF